MQFFIITKICFGKPKYNNGENEISNQELIYVLFLIHFNINNNDKLI